MASPSLSDAKDTTGARQIASCLGSAAVEKLRSPPPQASIPRARRRADRVVLWDRRRREAAISAAAGIDSPGTGEQRRASEPRRRGEGRAGRTGAAGKRDRVSELPGRPALPHLADERRGRVDAT